MNRRMKKVNAYIILVVMIFTTIFANFKMVFAGESTGMEPRSEVTYNKEYSEANIAFDVTAVSDKYQVNKLIAKDGEDQSKDTVIYDRNDKSAANEKPSIAVTKNGKYAFQVVYIVKSEAADLSLDSTAGNWDCGDTDEDNPTDGISAASTKTPEYTHDFTVEVEDIGKAVQKEKPALKSEEKVPDNAAAANVNNLFKISKATDGTVEPISKGNTITFPLSNSTGGAATSTFVLNFAKSFYLEGSFDSGVQESHGGAIFGFALHSNPNKTASSLYWNTCMVEPNMLSQEKDKSYKPTSTGDQIMKKGLLWQYIMFTHGSVSSQYRVGAGLYGIKMNENTHEPYQATGGTLATKNGYVQGNTYADVKTNAPFKISFDCHDSNTGEGTLTVDIAGYESTYDIVAKDVFGEDDGSGKNKGWHNVNFTMSASVHSKATKEASLTFNKYAYTGFNPVSQDTDEYIRYYKEEKGKMVEITPNTMIKKGEKIYGIVKIKNNGGAGSDDAGTPIDSTSSKYAVDEDFNINSVVQKQKAGTSYPAMAEQNVTSDISDLQEAYTDKDFDQLAASDFNGIQDGKIVLPYHNDTKNSYLKFSFKSKVSGMDTQTNLNLTVGKAPFATKTFLYQSKVYNAVDDPALSFDANKQYVAKDRAVDDAFMRTGVKGKLFDESALSDLDADGNDKKLTYTSLDTTSPGDKKITYTLEDQRTGLTTTAEKTFIVTDKAIIGNGKGMIDAENTYIKASDAKKLTSESGLITVMNAQAQQADGSKLQVTASADKFSDIKAGIIGKYQVNLEAHIANESAVIARTLTVIPDNGVTDGNMALFADGIAAIDKDEHITALDDIKKLLNLNAFDDGQDIAYTSSVSVSFTKQDMGLNEIKSQKMGMYEVKFTLGTLEWTSYIYQHGDDADVSTNHKYVVGAKNKLITSTEFIALTDDNALIRELGGYSKYYKDVDGGGNAVLDDMGIYAAKPSNYQVAQTAGTPGVYEITVKNGRTGDEYAEKTVYLTVTADNVVSSKDGTNTLQAESVIKTSDEMKAFGSSITDGILRTLNKVSGKSQAKDGSWSEVVPDVTDVIAGRRMDLAKGVPGIYLFTYSIGNQGDDNYVSKQANVTVVKNGTVTDGKDSVFARNGAVSSEEAKKFTDGKKDELLINALSATAMSINANGESKTKKPIVAIADDDWNKIKNGNTGEYDVTFRNGNQKITVKLTVAEVVTSGNEIFSGNTIKISKSEAERLLKLSKDDRMDELVAASNAKFTDKNSGNDIAITDYDSDLKGEIGKYSVTFKTTGGSEAAVEIRVSENVVVSGDIAIEANNIYLSVDEAKNKTDDMLKDRANAYGWNVKTKEEASVTVSSDNIREQTGTYDVTFAAGNAQVSVKAYVMDNVIVNKGSSICMGANNFSIAANDVNTLTKEKAVRLAGAKAWKADTNSELEITAFDNSKIKAKPGVYDAVFVTNTSEGTEQIDVKVKVMGHGGTTGDVAIFANDFSLSVNEAASLSLDDAVAYADAHAYSLSDHGKVNILKFDEAGNVLAKTGTYKGIFEADGGATVEVNVTVTTNGHKDNATKEQINANDIYIQKDDVATLDLDEAVKKANAKAVNRITNEEVKITAFDKKNIKAEIGTYPASFSTAKGTVQEIKVIVSDVLVEDGKSGERISANNFRVSVDEVKQLTLNEAVKRSNAHGFRISDGAEVKITAFDKSALKAEKGTYKLTFETAKGTKATVNVTVTDKLTIDTANKEGISANNFYIDKAEAKNLDKDAAVKKANAKAWNTEDNSEVEITLFDKGNLKAENGVYESYFKTAKGTTAPVQITVKDKVVIDTNTGEGMAADNFTVSVSDVKNLTLEKAVELSKAKAWKLDGNDTKVDITGFDKATALKAEKGTYKLTFTTDAGTCITVDVTVVSNLVNENGETITADIIHLSLDEVDNLDKDKAIEKANARAWQTADKNINVDITVFNRGNLKKEVGTYEGFFATAKGTKLPVKIVVTDSITEDKTKGEGISANNFALPKDKAGQITDEKLIELANAKAWKLSDGSAVEITGVTHQLKAEKGTYEVEFTTAKGTSVTVQATVTDSGIIEPPAGSDELYSVNNIYVSVDEAAGLDLDTAKERSNIKVWKKDDHSAVEVKSFDGSKVKAEVGTYNANFKTDNTTIPVKVIVKDEVTVDPANKEGISANNVSIPKSEIAGITDEKLIELAGAKAWSTVDGSAVKITGVTHKLKAEKGIYDVTFSTAKGTSITIQVTVTDNGMINNKTEEGIGANNFAVQVGEVQSLTLEKVIELSGAHAWKLKDGTKVPVTNWDRKDLKDEVGSYEIEISTDAGTKINITVTVKDSVVTDNKNKEYISANNIIIAKDEVANLNLDMAKELANAEAYETVNNTQVAITVFDGTKVKAELGTYDAFFATAKGTKAPIKVIVKDEVTIDKTNKEGIGANNFSIPKDKVLAITDDMLKELANAKAWNLSDGSAVEITGVTHQLKAKKGTYDVEFTTAKGTSVTVQATVTDSGVINPSAGIDEMFTANDIYIISDKVAVLDLDKAVDMSGAKAWKKSDHSPIKIVDFDKSNIKEKPGIYKGEFKTENGITYAVDVHVLTAMTEEKGVVIFARDFYLSVDEVSSNISKNKKAAANSFDELLINRASAYAFSKIDGSEKEITKIEHNIKAAKGIYKVKFTVETGASVEVAVTVKDNAVKGNGEEIIYADNFVAEGNEVAFLKDGSDKAFNELLKRSGAVAINENTGNEIAITDVDTSELKGVKGDYKVIFKTDISKADVMCSVLSDADIAGVNNGSDKSGNNENGNDMLTKTGDMISLGMLVTILLISLAGMTTIIVFVRKREKK